MKLEEKMEQETVLQPEAEGAEPQEQVENVITLTGDEFSKLKEHIESLQCKNDETIALAQRVQADFDNYRRRNASICADSREEGARSLIAELLPVIDGFDHAFEHMEVIDQAWADGIALLRKQFMEVLIRAGLSEIENSGMFDPELHDAVMQVEDGEKKSGEVASVFRKGYKVRDRIIRHSMVNVVK